MGLPAKVVEFKKEDCSYEMRMPLEQTLDKWLLLQEE